MSFIKVEWICILICYLVIGLISNFFMSLWNILLCIKIVHLRTRSDVTFYINVDMCLRYTLPVKVCTLLFVGCDRWVCGVRRNGDHGTKRFFSFENRLVVWVVSHEKGVKCTVNVMTFYAKFLENFSETQIFICLLTNSWR